jgi:putative radical SAM enzyme (TIGR03279 family)
MVTIVSVAPGSEAAQMDLEVGDQLVSINGHQINDLLDYHLQLESAYLQLEVLRRDDELWELALEKLPFADIGIEVEAPEPRQCGNQCVFCFVHQLPRGMRRTLYIKDEDYRFSYLYGAYVTLTNLSEADLERIIANRLSPLYISVHATDPALRQRLLGAEVAPLQPVIQLLTRAGIDLHGQVVLCPGINDGAVLERTIADLAAFRPHFQSLAVVPVGLTRFRQGLPQLDRVTPWQAQDCLDLIQAWQEHFQSEGGGRFVFAADEFYLLSGCPLPAVDEYEDFPQLENGVGMLAQFREQAQEVLLDAYPLELERATLVTGKLFAAELEAFLERLQLRCETQLDLVAIENRFFGDQVGVAGLITGRDLLEQLAQQDPGQGIILPKVMLKAGAEMFLDDLTLEDLRRQLKCPVIAVESSPWGILEGLEQLADGAVEIVRCAET